MPPLFRVFPHAHPWIPANPGSRRLRGGGSRRFLGGGSRRFPGGGSRRFLGGGSRRFLGGLFQGSPAGPRSAISPWGNRGKTGPILKKFLLRSDNPVFRAVAFLVSTAILQPVLRAFSVPRFWLGARARARAPGDMLCLY